MSNKRKNRKHKKHSPTGTDSSATATPPFTGRQPKHDHYSDKHKWNQYYSRRFRA